MTSVEERIRLRQIVLVTDALEPVIDTLMAIFGLSVCYGKADLTRYGIPYSPPPPHQAKFFEEHGLKSAQIPIGTTFLELLAPTREGTAAARYLQRRGPGGYMVLNEVAALAPFKERMKAAGVRIAGTVDYDTYKELQADPRDVGASMLSFAVQLVGEPFDGGWYPAGPKWRERAASGFRGIVAAELAVADPAAVSVAWAAVIGRKTREEGSVHIIELEESSLRFIEAEAGSHDRLDGIYIATENFAGACKAAAEKGALKGDAIAVAGLKFHDARELLT